MIILLQGKITILLFIDYVLVIFLVVTNLLWY
jgi:hypothetical protein